MKPRPLTNGGPKENRSERDFYATPREVTVALLDHLKLPPSHIWEPACGNGDMSRVLEEYGHTVYSSDITKECYGTGNTDFLMAKPARYDAIITNPPFFLADAFIQKAIEYAPVVAMVLKSQFWHAKCRQSLFRKHTPAHVLPLTWRPDFLFGERGGSPTMEVLWTVWIEGQYDAKYEPLKRPGNKMQQTAFSLDGEPPV